MKRQVQLILATIPLAALIWVYADQTGQQSQSIRIAVHLTAPPDIVPEADEHLPDAPEALAVQIEVRGPKLALSRMESEKGPHGIYFELSVPVAEDLTPGRPHSLDITGPVTAAVHERGLQLRSLSPSSIAYQVDRYQEIEVEVVPDPGSFNDALEGPPAVEPKSVKARVLQGDLLKLASRDEPLHLAIADELKARLGQSAQFSFDLPLGSQWQRISAQFRPKTVRISGRFKQAYDAQTISLIPLRVAVRWDWPHDKYLLQWADELDRTQKIDVQVPVGTGRAPTFNDVIAYVMVDDDLLPPETSPEAGSVPPAHEPSWHSLEVHFHFPSQEFKDVKIVSPPRTVKLRVVKRTDKAEPRPTSRP